MSNKKMIVALIVTALFLTKSYGSHQVFTGGTLSASKGGAPTAGVVGQIPYFGAGSTLTSPTGTAPNDLTWDATNGRLGVRVDTPQSILQLFKNGAGGTISDTSVILGNPAASLNTGTNTVIEGSGNQASSTAVSQHIEGNGNSALLASNHAHVEGNGNSVTSAINTHVEGSTNTIAAANSTSAHVEGQGHTYTTGLYGHMEGFTNSINIGTGTAPHVEGQNHTVSGTGALAPHIEGHTNTHNNAGTAVHMEGNANSVTGGGATISAHVQGSGNTLSGTCSYAHVGGRSNICSSGAYGFMHGYNLRDNALSATFLIGDDSGFTTQADLASQYKAKFANGHKRIKGGTSNLIDGPTEELKQATVTTADATDTLLLSFTTASNKTYIVDAKVTGDKASSASSTGCLIKYLVRNNAGTVTVSPFTNGLDIIADGAGSLCTFVVSGTTVQIRVVGEAASSYVWGVNAVYNWVH